MVDRMYSILPFEVDFYRKHGYAIDYVGNPTVDELFGRADADETFDRFTAENRLSDKPIIALLPGSRLAEIKDNLNIMIGAASSFPDYQIVIAGAPGVPPRFYEPYLRQGKVSIVFGKTYRLLQQSRAALVTSGTATLETALVASTASGRLFYEGRTVYLFAFQAVYQSRLYFFGQCLLPMLRW